MTPTSSTSSRNNDNNNETAKLPQKSQKKTLLIAVGILVAVVLVVVPLICLGILRGGRSSGGQSFNQSNHNNNNNNNNDDGVGRISDASSITSSSALPPSLDGLKKELEQQQQQQQQQQQCHVHDSIKTTSTVPLWMPGYAGSGFLIWEELLQKLTGLPALTVYAAPNHSCQGRSAVCITHWPFIGGNEFAPDEYSHAITRMDNGILLVLRNPMHAIPSYFTRWWGSQNKHIKRNHEQPPVADWIKWRDSRLKNHLQAWTDTLQKWHNESSEVVRGNGKHPMYLPYELIFDESEGPLMIQLLAQTLRDAGHDVIDHNVDKANLECIWRSVVQPGKHAKEYDWEYTQEQKGMLISTLGELVEQYKKDPVLRNILEYYEEEIQLKNLLKYYEKDSDDEDNDN